MRRAITYTLAVAAVLVFAAQITVAAEQGEKTGGAADAIKAAKCPVMGEAIDKSVSINYKGGRLYFCCQDCVGKFKKDTAKYAAKANVQLVLTGQAKQSACPFTGKKLDPSTEIKVGDVAVAFCCNACKGKATAAADDQRLEMVFGDKAFDKAFKVTKAEKRSKAKP